MNFIWKHFILTFSWNSTISSSQKPIKEKFHLTFGETNNSNICWKRKKSLCDGFSWRFYSIRLPSLFGFFHLSFAMYTWIICTCYYSKLMHDLTVWTLSILSCCYLCSALQCSHHKIRIDAYFAAYRLFYSSNCLRCEFEMPCNYSTRGTRLLYVRDFCIKL